MSVKKQFIGLADQLLQDELDKKESDLAHFIELAKKEYPDHKRFGYTATINAAAAIRLNKLIETSYRNQDPIYKKKKVNSYWTYVKAEGDLWYGLRILINPPSSRGITIKLGYLWKGEFADKDYLN